METTGEVGDVERRRRLAHHIAAAVGAGRRVESQSDYQAVLVRGHRPNHVLHLILSVVTFGLWVPVWLGVTVFGGEKRELLSVDEFGNCTVARL